MADLDRTLALLIKHAPALRTAGVVSVELDGFKAALTAADPVFVVPTRKPKDDEDEAPLDALDDPATFGGAVPGFTRPRADRDQEIDE